MGMYDLKSVFKLYPREKNEHKVVAVLTSGGDSQGMNAAIRAVVRLSLQLGMNIYLVKEGYHGLIEGDKYIVKAEWYDVSSILHKGGTFIGTKRCKNFMTREGRLKATQNMISHGISNLVVIGGDGSLTGANLFRDEWSCNIDELLQKGKINQVTHEKFTHINVVGIVGSIDNDFSGSDMTIGADSALQRILGAIDSLVSTAFSHQRTFILEIMGRTCGYLAIKSALMCEADYLFIREWPQKLNWPEKLCEHVVMARKSGKRLNIIIVSEGAVDENGTAITSEMVKTVLVEKLNHDARITVLGHVQRGGNPSAFDRILASRMGAIAVLSLIEATKESETKVICLKANKIIKLSLTECVKTTLEIEKGINQRDFQKAMELRGQGFVQNLETYKRVMNKEVTSKNNGNITLILNIGGSSNGINPLTYAIVRSTIVSGCRVLGAKFGVEGFIQGDVKELLWTDVIGWLNQGGVKLGITRTVPDAEMLEKIAKQLKHFNIKSCVISGGIEALKTGIKFCEAREQYEEFCIPVIVVPVTYSNNVPGTDFSLGADTALNKIVQECDTIRQSAEGHLPRVFVVEIIGGLCGYLTSMAALACGADASYIYEEKFNITNLMECLDKIVEKFEMKKITRGLVLRSEKANQNYTTSFVNVFLSEEGKDFFATRSSILGNIAMGDVPSPFDRSFAIKFGQMAVEWIQNAYSKFPEHSKSPDTGVLLGFIKNDYKFTPLKELEPLINEKNQFDNALWWLELRPLIRMLGEQNYWKEFN